MSLDKNNFFYQNPFHTFWMAGYECTDKLNCFGNRVDFMSVTGHLEKIDEDYQNLPLFNIKTVREGIRWSHVEKRPYEYDWTCVQTMITSAAKNGIQQIWDLCHFGFPDDLTPFHPMFARRFSSMCRAFVKFFRSVDPVSPLIVIPINEVSFLSWLGGDVCGTAPYCRRQGWEVKYHLMKAFIEGVQVMKEEDSNIRIMVSEPLVNVVPPIDATAEQVTDAAYRHEHQFQVLDMLSGRMCPELRGKAEYVDIIGCNFYYSNQWIATTGELLPWRNLDPDPRWVPLSLLLKRLYDRYKRPLVISETSHPKEDRDVWIEFITSQCCKVMEKGIPLWGVCWYPVIDRPDWDHLQPWHEAGLWDIDTTNGKLDRVLNEPAAAAFYSAQQMIRSFIPERKVITPLDKPLHAKDVIIK